MALTLNYTPQTQLDAVNAMLMSIGKSPLESLDLTIKDASFANYTLVQVLREVLKKGWDFNSDYEWELTPDVDEVIEVDTTILDIRPSDRSRDYAQVFNPDTTSMCIYDRREKSFALGTTSAIKFDIIWMFEFEQIPEAARAYIAHRAGRVFQANHVGSKIIWEFTKEREFETLAELERSHLNNARRNFFHGSVSTAFISDRQSGFRRRWL